MLLEFGQLCGLHGSIRRLDRDFLGQVRADEGKRSEAAVVRVIEVETDPITGDDLNMVERAIEADHRVPRLFNAKCATERAKSEPVMLQRTTRIKALCHADRFEDRGHNP